MLVVIRIHREDFPWAEVEPTTSYDLLIAKLQTWPVVHRGVKYKARSGHVEIITLSEDSISQVAFVIEMEESYGR